MIPDDAQATVLALADGESAVVIGAPGTGKTSTLIELVADRILRRGYDPSSVLALTTTRSTATALRDALATRVGRPTSGPLARTVNSIAFEIVRHAAALTGAPAPRLLTGGEQDSDVAQLLEGQIDDGTGPQWPPLLEPQVRRLRGFRTELRELMMRATEYGVSPERLRQLGAQHGRPEWEAAASFISEYLEVVSSSRPGQLDSAELVQFAIAALERGDVSETVASLRLVVVDDLQEATASTVGLLRALAARGVAIVAFGDPDVAANAFRGGEPDVLGRLGNALGLPRLATLTLSSAHRQRPELRQLTRVVTERIGTAGAVGHRAALAPAGSTDDELPPIVRIEAATPSRQWAAVARRLREHHLLGAMPWRRMAVIVRSGAQVPAAARALALADVPTRVAVGGTALRDDHAARALLNLVDIGTGRSSLTPEAASELLLGPFGGLDRLTLRRLRLALRAEELAGDGNRSSDELLVEALSAPGHLATIDHRVARNAARLGETLAELREASAKGSTIEELLWLAWERAGRPGSRREQALGTGIVAAEANRDLDGIVALFTAAKRFVEREPSSPAQVFLEAVLDAEVPEDTLSPTAAADSVLVTTPSGAIGLEVDVVVVASVQEGIWPNLRLRGSLLYPQQLVRVVTGLADVTLDERRDVLADELRMFALALSRARRQVIVSAVANDDEAASVFFALLPASAVQADAAVPVPLTLRGLTGRLRREITSLERSSAQRAAAASALATLAAAEVPGADPAQWHGLLEPSTAEPLFDDDEQVPVSPSKLEAFEQSPLDWFIESIAGSNPSPAMGIGTIVHWAMETATDTDVDAIWQAIEGRWQELLFEAPWLAERQKRATRILAVGVAEYLADFRRDGKALVGAESRFELTIDRATLRGSIDRVERAADGSVVIVDLKTGMPITNQQQIDEHPQLGAYQLAYAEGVLDEFLAELGEHRPGGAKLLYVKKGVRGKAYREGVQAALGEERLEGFRTRIRQAAIGMAAAAFDGVVELNAFNAGDVARRRLHRVRAVTSDRRG
ncbi:ATP-dependent DNA helicase [Microbacterium sp. STN6]|uniref:ATP-dependent DNA helicase n=1 Tax=Microbacterium sp. STN6 TaxID=2995588 RepID=UPI002260DD95|nr:ATP-dependent DNA helicase [Microbacterium sp. STN6]MCX7521945.1 ATP-dependent DNA helicase [Microbacterium sp. STN6]